MGQLHGDPAMLHLINYDQAGMYLKMALESSMDKAEITLRREGMWGRLMGAKGGKGAVENGGVGAVGGRAVGGAVKKRRKRLVGDGGKDNPVIL